MHAHITNLRVIASHVRHGPAMNRDLIIHPRHRAATMIERNTRFPTAARVLLIYFFQIYRFSQINNVRINVMI